MLLTMTGNLPPARAEVELQLVRSGEEYLF